MKRIQTVTIAKGVNPENAVQKLVDLLGGIPLKGKILIKPNIAHNRPAPVTTNKDVITTLITYLTDAKEILVGDSASYPTKHIMKRSWQQVLEDTGLNEAVREVGGEVVDLDQYEFVEVEIPENKVLRKPLISKLIFDVDHVINLPVMKTHHMTTITLCLKNLQGIIHDSQKTYAHLDNLHQKLVDIYRAVKDKFTLNIIDATIAMEGHGPGLGTPLYLNTLLASPDIVACDAVGCAIMGIDPFGIAHVRLANAQRLGEGRLDHINIVGDPLDKVKHYFALPDLAISGVYDKVDVYEGGTCQYCKAIVKTALQSLHKKGDISLVKDMHVIVGKNPSEPYTKSSLDFIIGDCACESSNFQGTRILGCPPFDAFVKIRKAVHNQEKR
ncbi:MAG: DUF362 domain-containing protein [Promethearchaeota archaeon]